ncbi:MAG: response regulator [Treponema sp.]|jgi:signal transduction histidine kinase/CheY-like chemotaxis protein/HPt (histidine-containing phosphotransfer) domain-containing protein|nr:response regulator [Treponema sp.]
MRNRPIENLSIKARFTLFVIFFLVTVFSLMLLLSALQVFEVTSLISTRMGLPVVEKAAAVIDGNAFEKLSQTLDAADPYYEKTRLAMREIWRESGCLYLYTLAPDRAENIYRFIIDGSGSPGDAVFSPLGEEEDIRDYDRALTRTFKTGKAEFSAFDYQKKWGWVISAYKPILNSRGNVVGVIGCDYEGGSVFYQLRSRIVSETAAALVITTVALAVYFRLLKKLDKQNARLLEMNRKASAASEAKNSFLANTGHELRVPMNAIIGMSELALREKTGNKAREFVNHILQAGGNLLIIINNILDYSKIESGKMVLSPGEYYPASLITDCIGITAARLRERQPDNSGTQGLPVPPVRLVVNISGGIPSRLLGDENRIRQILLAVLENAVNRTREGSVNFSVRRESTAELFQGETAVLIFETEDTGPEIKEEKPPLLFGEYSPFNRKAAVDMGSAGLGLAVSRRLARLMGGDIRAAPRGGGGSAFTVTLPQTVLDPAPFAPPPDGFWPEPAPAGGTVPFIAPFARVLVVDNVSANLMAAEKLFEPYKIQIDCCANGEGAVILLEEHPYDIVFMDHEMPGMDGTETTAAIRALDQDYVQKLPIIAITANAVSGLREYFLARKFNDYLLKPISAGGLREILEKWMPPEKRLDPGAYTAAGTPPAALGEEDAAQNRILSFPLPPVIKNLDTMKGLALTGGTETGYRSVLASFYYDARGRLDFFLELPEAENLSLFIVQVHALKSASAAIGAAKISAEAAALEEAGTRGSIGDIEDKLPVFYEDLSDLVSAIGEALGL